MAARAVRDDALLIEASARPAPDLAALTAAQVAAAEALADAEATHRTVRETAGRIEALRTQLLDSLSDWAPVREAHELAARVANFAEGKAADNRAQMRLSAYVLSWRFGQVVDAANARLSRMSDQRYALEHTALRCAGETRGGLSLLVRDEWSGEARDPVTLSGGETFVVSLALALGLTDVVTQEAGVDQQGADIGTLFVDEGFGSLDADTLDDVMDTLDALRDGGRVVGVVSHVAEMRDRIPTRLQIDKSRSGSTARLVRSVSCPRRGPPAVDTERSDDCTSRVGDPVHARADARQLRLHRTPMARTNSPCARLGHRDSAIHSLQLRPVHRCDGHRQPHPTPGS